MAEGIEVLSRPAAAMPVPIPKAKLNVNLDTELGLRPVVLRHLGERSVFRVQECLGRAFRDYLRDQGFTGDPHPQDRTRRSGRAAPTSSGWTILGGKPFWPSLPSLQADHGGSL